MLVTTTLSMLAFQFAWGLYLFITSFTNVDATTATVLLNYNGGFNYHGWQAALVIYMIVLGAASVMLGELMSFHLVLVYKGMTTYDYIMAQKEVASPSPVSTSLNWRQHALCRANNRVIDSATPVTRRKIGLNPCKALMTPKQEPRAQAWRLPVARLQTGGSPDGGKPALGHGGGSSGSSRASFVPSSVATAAPVAEQRVTGLSGEWQAQQDGGGSGFAAPITNSNSRYSARYQESREYRAYGGHSSLTALSSSPGESTGSSHIHLSAAKPHSEGVRGHQTTAGLKRPLMCLASGPLHPAQQDNTGSGAHPRDTSALHLQSVSGGLSAFSRCVPGGLPSQHSMSLQEAAQESEGFDAAAGMGAFSSHESGGSSSKLTSVWNQTVSPASSLPTTPSLQRYFPAASPYFGHSHQQDSVQQHSPTQHQSPIPFRPLPGLGQSGYLGGASVPTGNHLGGFTIGGQSQTYSPLHLNLHASSQPSSAPHVAYPHSPTSSRRLEPMQQQQQSLIYSSISQPQSSHLGQTQNTAADGASQTRAYQSVLSGSSPLDVYPALPVGVGGHVSA